MNIFKGQGILIQAVEGPGKDEESRDANAHFISEAVRVHAAAKAVIEAWKQVGTTGPLHQALCKLNIEMGTDLDLDCPSEEADHD